MTENSQSPSRFGRMVEYIFLVVVLLQFAMLLSAVISRFRFRLLPFPGSSYAHDGRFGFDFSQTMSGLGFTIIFLMTLPCLILFILTVTAMRSPHNPQTFRISILFVIGALLWLPSLMAMMAYSF